VSAAGPERRGSAERQPPSPPRGRPRLERVIPAGTAEAFAVTRGQVVRIVDVEGQQAVDVVAYNLHATDEALSTEITVLILRTSNPSTGHTLYSTEWHPMLTIVADTVRTNYLPGAICSDEANFFRYGIRGTLNCRDNLALAVAPWGISKRQVQGALGAFINMAYLPDGRTEIQYPISRAGDYVEVRAEMDLLIGVSACPQVRNPCNAYNPTPVGVVLFDADAAES
jgi:uncharacterized protein YcgI (DUF1989 family)